MITLWSAAFAATVALDAETVVVLRPGAIERLDLATLTPRGGLPVDNTAVVDLAVQGARTVAVSRARAWVWRDEELIADLNLLDDRWGGLHFDHHGLVWVGGRTDLVRIDPSTGVHQRTETPIAGWLHPHDRDDAGWIADDVGVIAPDGNPGVLHGRCRFAGTSAGHLAVCQDAGAVFAAGLDGAGRRVLPGDELLAVGPAGALTYAASDDQTRWVDLDGTVRHQLPGRWAGAVGPAQVVFVLADRLCVVADAARCVDLGAPDATRQVPSASTLLLVGGTSTVAVDPADGHTRWSVARGGRTDGRLAGLDASAQGYTLAPTPAAPETTPAPDRSRIGVADGLTLRSVEGGIEALDGAGKRRWSLPLADGPWHLLGEGGGLALLSSRTGRVVLDVRLGKEVRRLSTPTLDLPDPLLPTWIAVVAGKDGPTDVVDARDGSPVFRLPDKGSMERMPDGALLRVAPRGPWAVEVWDRDVLRWRVVVGQLPVVHPVGDLVVLQAGAMLVAVDASTGAVRWGRPSWTPLVSSQLLAP